jgi:hypothetical protein
MTAIIYTSELKFSISDSGKGMIAFLKMCWYYELKSGLRTNIVPMEKTVDLQAQLKIVPLNRL